MKLHQSSRWFLLIFLICIVTPSFAQESGKIDSVINLLKTGRNDSSRLINHIRLFELYHGYDSLTANKYLELARKDILEGDIEVSPALLYSVGKIFQEQKADYNTAIAFFTRAATKAMEINNPDWIDYESLVGYTLSTTGNPEQGLVHALRAVEASENLRLVEKMPRSYILLAFVFRNAEQIERAELYFRKSIEASMKISDSTYIHTALSEIGNTYLLRRDYSQALLYHKKALTYREGKNMKEDLLYSYNDIAQDYFYLDSTDRTLEYYGKAKKLAIEIGERLNLFNIENGMAFVYLHYNDLEKVKISLAEMRRLAAELKLMPVYQMLYDREYTYYKALGQFEKALKYYELSRAYSDSITNQEVRKNIAELDKKYQTAKKDKELMKKQESIKRQQILITFIFLGAMFLVVFAIVVFRNYHQKKSAYDELEIKNQEVLKQREEIILAKNEAERSNNAKSEFLSRMSHELRTPMNAILGYAQLLENGDLTPKQRKGVNHILNNGQHLLSLINDVLDISGIEAGRQRLAIEPVQLAAIIEEVTDSMQVVAAKRDVSIEYTDVMDKRLFLLADRRRLKQILINMLGNAIKYNREGGKVTIEAALQPMIPGTRQTVRISLTDTGVGIAPEDIGKLFQAFERIGAENSGTEGTGLGLVVVKKLIEEMGGTVGVESEAGVGSTFWIEISCTETDGEMISQAPAGSNSIPHKTSQFKTVLYIEDDQSNIELVEDILAENRPEIRLVVSKYGRQTVALAIEHDPACILLDLDLPDMKGREVLGLILDDFNTRTIPVVILSADAMTYQVDKLTKAGAAGYLTKPLDVAQFIEIIDRIIEK